MELFGGANRQDDQLRQPTLDRGDVNELVFTMDSAASGQPDADRRDAAADRDVGVGAGSVAGGLRRRPRPRTSTAGADEPAFGRGDAGGPVANHLDIDT